MYRGGFLGETALVGLEVPETSLHARNFLAPKPFKTHPMKRNQKHFVKITFFTLMILAALTAILLTTNHPRSGSATPPSVAKLSPAEPNPPTTTSNGEALTRPLPVSHSGTHHEWTSLDAKDPEVISRIAHNLEEIKRLTEENARIKRRQLVYRKDTVPDLLQRLGEHSLKEFTLPGLDGREFEVEVVETRLNGLQAGSVLGRVKGVLNSMVSVGFFNGCESFNICLPDEKYYLTADAREPGEVLVKEIDPDVYTPPTKCEPIVIE